MAPQVSCRRPKTRSKRPANASLEQVLAGMDGGAHAKLQLRVFDGRPADIIGKVAEEPQVGLVVVGSRGHSSMGDLVLGSGQPRVVTSLPKAASDRPRAWHRQPESDARIVVGVDGSAESAVALRWAATEAQARARPTRGGHRVGIAHRRGP